MCIACLAGPIDSLLLEASEASRLLQIRARFELLVKQGVDVLADGVMTLAQADGALDDPVYALARVQDNVYQMKVIFDAAYDEFYTDGHRLGRIKANRQFALGVNLDSTNEWAEATAKEFAFKSSEFTASRIVGDVADAIFKANREGLGIYDTRRDYLEHVFTDMKGWQLDRISRTELHSVDQLGVQASFGEAGVSHKMWLSKIDARTRRKPANHVKMDREIALVNALFSNGLMFPGDKNGRLVEFIQCRCRMRPHWPDGR